MTNRERWTAVAVMVALHLATGAVCGCALALDMDAAMSEEFMAKRAVTSDVADEIARCEAELQEMGMQLVERTDGVSRAMTLPHEVWLPAGFFEWPEASQLVLLRHEIRHARQWREMGVLVFGASYINYADTWALEMHGYRQMVRDRWDLGDSRADIEAMIERLTKGRKKFSRAYHYLPHHRKQVDKATRQALTRELDVYSSVRERAVAN